jgi:hypothetical protein
MGPGYAGLVAGIHAGHARRVSELLTGIGNARAAGVAARANIRSSAFAGVAGMGASLGGLYGMGHHDNQSPSPSNSSGRTVSGNGSGVVPPSESDPGNEGDAAATNANE